MAQFDITINESLKEHLNEVEQITLQVLSGKVFEMIQQELPKQVSSNVLIQSIVLSNTSLKSIKTNDLVPAMLIKGTDQNTKKVPFLFLCKQALVRHCINQIMGLENNPGVETKFDEFDMSAASEMMNAIFQQAAMQISEVANKEVNGLIPSVGLFKNFGDFLQTLRLTSDAPITQIQFDIRIGDESASPCLIVMDFKAMNKFISEIGSLAMDLSNDLEQSQNDPVEEPTQETSTPQGGGVMSQDAIEAMLAQKAKEASSTSIRNEAAESKQTAPSASNIPTSSPSSGGVMSQDAIEAMLARKAAEATPTAIENEAAESKQAAPSSSKASNIPTSSPSSGGVMSQDAIEAMLARKAAEATPTVIQNEAAENKQAAPSSSKASNIPTSSPSSGGVMSPDAIEAMLAKKAAETSVPSKPTPVLTEAKRSIASLHYGNNESNVAQTKRKQELPAVEEPQTFFSVPMIQSNMDLVMNVPLTISVEIGSTKKKVKEILEFQPGTVIELDKQHNSPMDVIVNGELFARGEVVVFEENFGVRLTEINSKLNSNNQ